MEPQLGVNGSNPLPLRTSNRASNCLPPAKASEATLLSGIRLAAFCILAACPSGYVARRIEQNGCTCSSDGEACPVFELSGGAGLLQLVLIAIKDLYSRVTTDAWLF